MAISVAMSQDSPGRRLRGPTTSAAPPASDQGTTRCGGQEGKGGTVSEANKELVRRHFEEIFNRKNLEVCDEMMAEDYVEHAGTRAPYHAPNTSRFVPQPGRASGRFHASRQG